MAADGGLSKRCLKTKVWNYSVVFIFAQLLFLASLWTDGWIGEDLLS